MVQVLRAAGVLAAGTVVAIVLAYATFAAWFAEFGLDGHGWDDVEGTWVLIGRLVVIALHVVWMVAWCSARRVGWFRFVAAGLLVPSGTFMTVSAVQLARLMATDASRRWSLGEPLRAHAALEPPGTGVFLLAVVLPAIFLMAWGRARA